MAQGAYNGSACSGNAASCTHADLCGWRSHRNVASDCPTAKTQPRRPVCQVGDLLELDGATWRVKQINLMYTLTKVRPQEGLRAWDSYTVRWSFGLFTAWEAAGNMPSLDMACQARPAPSVAITLRRQSPTYEPGRRVSLPSCPAAHGRALLLPQHAHAAVAGRQPEPRRGGDAHDGPGAGRAAGAAGAHGERTPRPLARDCVVFCRWHGDSGALRRVLCYAALLIERARNKLSATTLPCSPSSHLAMPISGAQGALARFYEKNTADLSACPVVNLSNLEVRRAKAWAATSRPPDRILHCRPSGRGYDALPPSCSLLLVSCASVALRQRHLGADCDTAPARPCTGPAQGARVHLLGVQLRCQRGPPRPRIQDDALVRGPGLPLKAAAHLHARAPPAAAGGARGAACAAGRRRRRRGARRRPAGARGYHWGACRRGRGRRRAVWPPGRRGHGRCRLAGGASKASRRSERSSLQAGSAAVTRAPTSRLQNFEGQLLLSAGPILLFCPRR